MRHAALLVEAVFGLYVPAVQALQDAEPTVDWYRPTAHCMQVEAPLPLDERGSTDTARALLTDALRTRIEQPSKKHLTQARVTTQG